MENLVTNQVIRTTLSGTIEGKAVTINYENKVGEVPANVNAVCSIPDPENPMRSTHINVNVSNGGNKTINITGNVSLGDIQVLLTGMEAEVQTVLTPLI